MGDLTKLIARVEALTGPDGGVEKAILLHLGYSWRGMDYWHFDNRKTWGQSPFLTSSIDAAVAFSKRMLPQWACGFDDGPKTCIAFVDPYDHADRFLGARYTAEGPTPAIALILATLKALAAKEVERD